MRLAPRTSHKLFLLLTPPFSGFLLVLTFPKHDLAWLSWVGLVPFLLALSDSSSRKSVWLSFLCGLIFFPGVFNWILEIKGYTVLHHAILGLYLSSYLALFGIAFSLILKRFGLTVGLLFAPCLWVSMEFIRSNLGFMALPWALLGHSQYQNKWIIQVSSFTGAYGVSFLIVMVNSAITGLLYPWIPWREEAQRGSKALQARAGRISLAVTAFVLTSAAALYGHNELPPGRVAEKGITVSVIQGNIEQDKKWDPRLAEWIMERYANLSREASRDRPRMIVWPEAATPGYVLKNLALLKKLLLMIQEINTYFLIGSSEYPKFAKGPIDPSKGGNTALLFSPEAKLLGQYIKVRLVPFEEAIPYQGVIPWPQFIVPEGRRTYLIPGEDVTLFSLDDGCKFGVLICWETLFPDLFRAFVKKGAHFIANISNEAAFGETAFPYQFLAITIFRAVENRISIVKAANTGISCFIDPYGRISAKLEKNHKEIFVEGHLTHQISVSEKTSFYTMHGDIFAYACLAVSAFMMGLLILKRREP